MIVVPYLSVYVSPTQFQSQLEHYNTKIACMFQVLQKYMPGGFAGFDKKGSPILVELFGYLDAKGILHSARKADIEKCKLQLGENITKLLDEQSKKVHFFCM